MSREHDVTVNERQCNDFILSCSLHKRDEKLERYDEIILEICRESQFNDSEASEYSEWKAIKVSVGTQSILMSWVSQK